MPVYLDTRGNSVLSIAVCDRCNRKFPYVDLMPDPNSPGMRVCADDLDNFDPWRLPAIQTENIALRFPRPDVSVATGPIGGNQIMTENGFTNDNSLFIQGVSPFSGNTQGDLNTASNVPPNIQVLFPYIYTVTPDNGLQSGGNLVTLMGANFTDVNTVKFGGVVASFSLVNSTQIVATAPSYPITGLVDVSAASPFGTATKHGGYTYTATSAPIVLGITPNNGTIAGETPVTITGSNFTGATEVKIGPLPSYSFVVVNDNTITTTTVPYSAGSVNVTVTTPYGTGTGTNLFTYTA